MNQKDNEAFEIWIDELRFEHENPMVKEFYKNHFHKFYYCWSCACDYKNEKIEELWDRIHSEFGCSGECLGDIEPCKKDNGKKS